MKMFFKNTLKLSIALLIATPSLAASFQGVCNELNEELMANVKKNLREELIKLNILNLLKNVVLIRTVKLMKCI